MTASGNRLLTTGANLRHQLPDAPVFIKAGAIKNIAKKPGQRGAITRQRLAEKTI